MIFILLSIVAAVLVIVAGVFRCQTGLFTNVVIGVYLVIFGACTIVMELFYPPALASWFGFYARWIGRGLWFFFLGCLIIEQPNSRWDNFGFWAGVVIIVVGILYFIFGFLPFIQKPTPVKGNNIFTIKCFLFN